MKKRGAADGRAPRRRSDVVDYCGISEPVGAPSIVLLLLL